MRRTLRGAVGVVLAIGAVLPALPASAQSIQQPRWYQSSQTQWYQSPSIRKVQYERPAVLHEEHLRLEEMKVELALLSDIATFSYDLGARAAGDTLALRGYVPNDMVRQRVLEIARRSTFLTVKDELKAQKSLSLSVRPAETLREEGMEMLRQKLGERARQMTLAVRPSGIVVLTGRIDSMESKVEISRLFRQLSGCFGIVNELIVEQVLRDGQRVVQVTRDGSMLVSPAALGLEPQTIFTSSPIPAVVKPTPSPISAVVKPTPLPDRPNRTHQPDKVASTSSAAKPTVLPTPPLLPGRGLAAQDAELRLPHLSPPAHGQPKATPQNQGLSLETLTPPQLPTKWSQPATSRKSQEVKRQASPTATSSSGTQDKTPTVLPSPLRWIDTQKPTPTADAKKPTSTADAKKPTPSADAEAHPAPADMSWHPPQGSEESEPNTRVATQKPEMPSRISTPTTPSVSPSRRWPPAYETHSSQSSESKGRPGLITFDDDPPAPKPPVAPMGSLHPVVPSNLYRQVKSVCGRQARDVLVEVQRDGAILVTVKVPNQSAEGQLTKKILSIPEMTSPQVRLLMDVGP